MGKSLLGDGSLLLSFTSLKRTMLLLLLSIFTYVSADADAQVPISVPGVQYYRYPTPAVDTPIVTPALRSPIVTPALNTPIVTPADETGLSLTPALRSPIVTQALNTPIITPALGAPPIVLPAGQDGVALRSQFLQPAALGGRVYYTSNSYTPNTVYYTPNTTFKKTPEDLTKLIKAYSDLSPDTKKVHLRTKPVPGLAEAGDCGVLRKQLINWLRQGIHARDPL